MRGLSLDLYEASWGGAYSSKDVNSETSLPDQAGPREVHRDF